MARGGKFFVAGGCLAVAACAQTGGVKVRAIADPAAKLRFGGGLLSDARAQLALGDVGIALETFQTLAREQPENPDAYAGIAACYAAMGRYDIARQNYEIALAYAPNDPALLTALAYSLERLGQADEAAQARLEAARLRTAPPVPVSVAQTRVTSVAVPRLSSITVKLPPATPVSKPSAGPRAQPVTETAALAQRSDIAIPASRRVRQTAGLSAAPATPKRAFPEAGIALPELAETAKPLSAATPAPELKPVVVKLPSIPFATEKVLGAPTVEMAMPADPAETHAQSAKKQQPASVVEKPREAVIARAEPRADWSPRLERLSPVEVSLVTNPLPTRVAHSWPRLPQPSFPSRTDVVMNEPLRSAPRLASADPVRWVQLKYAPAQSIELLNAARAENLAARTRIALLNTGWRKIRIGNARKARQHSLVLYASARWAVAHRLAAHFGCKAVRTDRVQNVVVLLGRDVALSRRSSARA